VNVFIGENGTGKSHLLKLLYVLNEGVRQFQTRETGPSSETAESLEESLSALFLGVFQPDSLGRLVRRGRGRRKAKISATWTSGEQECTVDVTITSQNRLAATSSSLPDLERSVFIPTREVLSLFPGFVAAYIRRESAFDRTYYDLCVSLDAKPLRGPRDAVRADLLRPLEEALGGRVINDGGRFYLALPDGHMEAPLVAEGLRKLAMLHYLIVNGSLTANGFMFWDEPEANMNPRLTRLTGTTVFGLAAAGVQTFLATHDYILTSEMALAAETSADHAATFFALGRDPQYEGTFVEAARQLNDIQHNSILQALADLHERQERVFTGAGDDS
jgi:hypothetical protein